MSKRKPGIKVWVTRVKDPDHADEFDVEIWISRKKPLPDVFDNFVLYGDGDYTICCRGFRRLTGSCPKPGECKRYTLWGKETKS